MITCNQNLGGFHIAAVETCDFDTLSALNNKEVLARAGQKDGDKLSRFIEKKMGIERRFHCDDDTDALDLARQALSKLIKHNPNITQEADFFIYAGISNPMPVATHSALLASEFNFYRPSCWDIKSGCSSGVLALIQANAWLNMGAKRGVIVASETMSKFADPNTLQMSAAVGDGSAALIVEKSDKWQINSMVHGTDPQYVTNMLVKGKMPVANEDYERDNYRFTFNDKGNGVQVLGEYWVQSLVDLLEQAKIAGEDVQYYFAHQVDGSKNAKIASVCGIADNAVAKNFRHYGNMGAPTIFINYKHWMDANHPTFKQGENMIFHAVGGGLSWAGLCMEYTG